MRYLLVLLAAVTACTVSAQTATKKPATRAAVPAPQEKQVPAPAATVEIAWEMELDAFLGIKFNKPFDVKRCPTKTLGTKFSSEMPDFEAFKSLPGVCLNTFADGYRAQQAENGTFKLDHLPDLGIWYAASVHLKDFNVSKITIDLQHSDFVTLLTAFKDRYGAPTLIESDDRGCRVPGS